jgi:hypothetical protein
MFDLLGSTALSLATSEAEDEGRERLSSKLNCSMTIGAFPLFFRESCCWLFELALFQYGSTWFRSSLSAHGEEVVVPEAMSLKTGWTSSGICWLLVRETGKGYR